MKLGAMLVGTLFALAPTMARAQRPGAGVAVVGGTVLSLRDGARLPDHTVLVRGDTVQRVGPREVTPVPEGFQVIDARGRWVAPGLADMHVHLSDRSELLSYVRDGVTTVLQMSGQRGEITDFLTLRAEIERGDRIGPRLYLTGPMFDRPGLPRQTTAYVYAEGDLRGRS